MLAHVKRRLSTLQADLGYQNYSAAGSMNQLASQASLLSLQGYGLPFIAKQHIQHLIFQCEMDWRAPIYGGIWQDSNLHLPLPRRLVQQNASRCADHLFGSKPYFSADPIHKKDAASNQAAFDLAAKLNPWAQFEADQAGADAVLTEAVQLAFIQGQQVVKPYYEKKVQYYSSYETVAIDATGKPLIMQDGGYLYQRDKWIEAVNQFTGQPGMVLARDGQTPKRRAAYGFKRTLVEKELIMFEGARLTNIPYTAFLAPLTAPTLVQADAWFHLYTERLVDLIARWAPADTGASLTAKELRERSARFIYDFAGGGQKDDYRPDAAARGDLGESPGQIGTDTTEPGLTVAEGGIWFDPLQNGNQANIFIVVDAPSGAPIYYDYMCNVARWNKGAPPVTEVRINPVPNRWHGRSQIELYYKVGETIDLQLNRWNRSQTAAGRIDGVERNAFYNFDHGAEVILNSGVVLELKEGHRKEDSLWSHYFNEIKGSDLQGIIQLMMQLLTNMSGVASSNDAQAAGLDSQKTATGINQIAASGDELTGSFDKQIKPAMERILASFFKLSAEGLTSARAFTYFEGDVQQTDAITPELVADLDLYVSLLMSRAKADHANQTHQLAYGAMTNYFSLPPEVQARMAGFVRQWMREAFDVQDIDEIIPDMAQQQMQQQQDPLALPSQSGADPQAAATAAQPQQQQPQPEDIPL